MAGGKPGSPRKTLRDYRYDPDVALEHRRDVIAALDPAKGRVLPPYYPREPIPAGDPLSPGGALVTASELAPDARAAVTLIVGGHLDVLDLPAFGLAASVIGEPRELTTLRARRLVPGSSGITAIHLEINDSPILGASLFWEPSDVVNALKSVTFSPKAVGAGDRVSLRITSVETGAKDVVGVSF